MDMACFVASQQLQPGSPVCTTPITTPDGQAPGREDLEASPSNPRPLAGKASHPTPPPARTPARAGQRGQTDHDEACRSAAERNALPFPLPLDEHQHGPAAPTVPSPG